MIVILDQQAEWADARSAGHRSHYVPDAHWWEHSHPAEGEIWRQDATNAERVRKTPALYNKVSSKSPIKRSTTKHSSSNNPNCSSWFVQMFLFLTSETCRCLRSCSALHVQSSCPQWSRTTTTSTPTTTRNHSSSSWRCLLRRYSSKRSSPPFAGRLTHGFLLTLDVCHAAAGDTSRRDDVARRV